MAGGRATGDEFGIWFGVTVTVGGGEATCSTSDVGPITGRSVGNAAAVGFAVATVAVGADDLSVDAAGSGAGVGEESGVGPLQANTTSNTAATTVPRQRSRPNRIRVPIHMISG